MSTAFKHKGTRQSVLIALRLFFGLLTLTAISVQINSLVQQGAFHAVNFLSYFTNLSNLFAAAVFIISALRLAAHRRPSAREDLVRGAAVLYIAAVGVVYVTLLSGEDLGLLIPWVNMVLHYLMPLFAVFDWLYQPPNTNVRFKRMLLWLIFPIGLPRICADPRLDRREVSISLCRSCAGGRLRWHRPVWVANRPASPIVVGAQHLGRLKYSGPAHPVGLQMTMSSSSLGPNSRYCLHLAAAWVCDQMRNDVRPAEFGASHGWQRGGNAAQEV